jgi:prophage regulatory protein
MQAPQIVKRPAAHVEQIGSALIEKIKIIKRREVEDATGMSRSSLYRLAAAGEFPRPIKLGPRAVGWRADEIAAWIEERTAERDGKGAQ